MSKMKVMILDTETCNTYVGADGKPCMDDAMVYDIGYSVADLDGGVYEDQSYINAPIFCGMKDVMASAYYAAKIPQYWADLKAGSRQMLSMEHIRNNIWDAIEKYDIKAIVAHNAHFDVNALNQTWRYLTKSRNRYFFPAKVEIWDSLMMARSIMSFRKTPSSHVEYRKTYKDFCESRDVNGTYLDSHGHPRFTAEILYQYIHKDDTFIESHTALEDVKIEREIMWYCFRQHQKMKRVLYESRVKTP